MSKGAIIDELAAELEASAEARKKWRQRGMPFRWRLEIIELAAKRGISLTNDDFERWPTADRSAA